MGGGLPFAHGRSRGPAYPETDLAPRDRIAPCAATPFARGVMASTAFTAARLHRRAGEPGHRVCGRPPAGAVLWAVTVHLGGADRADLDLPDNRVLRRRPPGRPPPGCGTAGFIRRCGRSS